MDNVIHVDFSRKDQVNELVSRKLDEEKITDADLRRAVSNRAEIWRSWLTPRLNIKAENISLTLTDLPEDVREAARPEIQQWMVEHLSAWFKEAGMEAISEVIGSRYWSGGFTSEGARVRHNLSLGHLRAGGV